MNRRTWTTRFIASALLLWAASAMAQIYKIVDEQGNITFTDQAPFDGAEPMVLPELSVVETEPPPAATEEAAPAVEETEAAEPTPRELRRMYRDFRITRPQPEETFWGTENTVVVSWGSSTPLRPGMNVRLILNGAPQGDYTEPMTAITLDRGEHNVAAELRDARGRRVILTEPVTFFVHQFSANFNQPQVAPRNN